MGIFDRASGLLDRGSGGGSSRDGPDWFDPKTEEVEAGRLAELIAGAGGRAGSIDGVVEERSVEVNEELDEDAFFSTVGGYPTIVNRYDLEQAVPPEKKSHFVETDRYWVNKPYAFVVIFHSRKENETKYYLIEPHLTPIEEDLREFLSQKLRTAIKYESDDVLVEEGQDRGEVIEREARRLLNRYDLYRESSSDSSSSGFLGGMFGGSNGEDAKESSSSGFIGGMFGGSNGEDVADGEHADEEPTEATEEADSATSGGMLSGMLGVFGFGGTDAEDGEDGEEAPTVTAYDTGPIEGVTARPEPAVIEEDSKLLSEYQVEKLLYYLKRDFVGFERIDGIKHDINVEDISVDGYNSPVFVYHGDHENIITNVYHGEEELDDFVVKLAQRSGKGISKRQPQVDATLPDGSRSQLTLGREVSDHGTNYTIRQFKDVPFTPIDLINWRTFSLEQMAFLWLAIENNKSLIFAGGTASGKTTSLNAVSLFIPSNAKIVSIEDTREVELPQRNWIASVTRPSFTDDDKGDIDEFDLLEAALRQRPDYIVMGEIRGEEGRTLFQVMSTGHTTYTTFHADSVGEVLKRFTTEPINVSKTLFTALDLVSIQRQTRLRGRKLRRSMSITEINEYSAENDEINVQDVYQWRADADEFDHVGRSNVIDEIRFDRGWTTEELEKELFKRRVVLAYLIRNGLNDYAQVAATIQSFIADPETALALIANDALADGLSDLREMESVHIDIDPEMEEMVPRPDPDEEMYEHVGTILEQAEDHLFDEYRDADVPIGAFKRSLEAAAGGDASADAAPEQSEDAGGDGWEALTQAGASDDEDAAEPATAPEDQAAATAQAGPFGGTATEPAGEEEEGDDSVEQALSETFGSGSPRDPLGPSDSTEPDPDDDGSFSRIFGSGGNGQDVPEQDDDPLADAFDEFGEEESGRQEGSE